MPNEPNEYSNNYFGHTEGQQESQRLRKDPVPGFPWFIVHGVPGVSRMFRHRLTPL